MQLFGRDRDLAVHTARATVGIGGGLDDWFCMCPRASIQSVSTEMEHVLAGLHTVCSSIPTLAVVIVTDAIA